MLMLAFSTGNHHWQTPSTSTCRNMEKHGMARSSQLGLNPSNLARLGKSQRNMAKLQHDRTQRVSTLGYANDMRSFHFVTSHTNSCQLAVVGGQRNKPIGSAVSYGLAEPQSDPYSFLNVGKKACICVNISFFSFFVYRRIWRWDLGKKGSGGGVWERRNEGKNRIFFA